MVNATQQAKDEAVRLYVETHRSVRDISRRTGVSQPTLYAELRRRFNGQVPARALGAPSGPPSAALSAQEALNPSAQAGASERDSTGPSTPADASKREGTRSEAPGGGSKREGTRLDAPPSGPSTDGMALRVESYEEELPPKALKWEPPSAKEAPNLSAKGSAPSTDGMALAGARARAPAPSAQEVLKRIRCPRCQRELFLEPAEQVPGAAVQCPGCRRKLIVEAEDL